MPGKTPGKEAEYHVENSYGRQEGRAGVIAAALLRVIASKET
jgi:hypothetical protein